MKLPTSQEMRALDTSAINDFCIPGIVLMENAGLGTVKMIEHQCGSCKDTFTLIFVGPGNNGGDGLVIGRHLHQRGCQPIFFFLVNPDTLTGDAAVNFRIVQKLKLSCHVIDTQNRIETIPILLKELESGGQPCYAIIDAIFGIGLTRKVESHFADTIELINSKDFCHKSPVISVDIPSGLDSNTGRMLGTCVRANFTATYCCAKPGHFIHASESSVGKLEIIDIGIPPETLQQTDVQTELSTKDGFRKMAGGLSRKKGSHKGDHGHLLILAGSSGKTGAAILAARGGMRTGAGLVSLLAPDNLNSIYEISLIEAMTIPLPVSSDFFQYDDIDIILQNLSGKDALVIGPGLGTEESTKRLVLQLYHDANCPLILDADGLNILALCSDQIGTPAASRIFTPHPGELSRLIDKSTAEVQNNRLEAANAVCQLFKNPVHDIIVVLKGAGTLITTGDGSTVINTTGNPGMATGGMGDVLSGIIGALICQGLSVHSASVAGVYLHGKTGDDLFKLYGAGYTAGELADRIPVALKELLAGR